MVRELIIRNFVPTLNNLGSLWSVLSRDLTRYDFDFNRLQLVSGQRIGYGRTGWRQKGQIGRFCNNPQKMMVFWAGFLSVVIVRS